MTRRAHGQVDRFQAPFEDLEEGQKRINLRRNKSCRNKSSPLGRAGEARQAAWQGRLRKSFCPAGPGSAKKALSEAGNQGLANKNAGV
jgi:hypothetical protein